MNPPKILSALAILVAIIGLLLFPVINAAAEEPASAPQPVVSGGLVSDEPAMVSETLGSGFIQESGAVQKSILSVEPGQDFSPGGECSVAILGSPGDPIWNIDVKNQIAGTGIFEAEDITIINIATVTPTLEQLQSFAAVLVYSDAPGYEDSTEFGDNLADYVDWGGGVVVAVFSNASLPFNGRFDTDNYWVVKPSGQKSGTEKFLGTIHVSGHPILNKVGTFSGGSYSFRMSSVSLAAGASRIADWTDSRPLVATRIINGARRADLGFFPPSSVARNGFWRTTTDGALLMANALNWVKRPNCEDCELETFSDPLGDWLTGWFYLNTNVENIYTADGTNCDPDYRSNQPEGLWLSDDRGCGSIIGQSPVRIDFLNNYGDNATAFSMDHYTCVPGVTFNVYDKDGTLAFSEPLSPDCFNFSRFKIILTNGISAFEYAYTGGRAEGNTAIDNVELCFFDFCECDLNRDGDCNDDDFLQFITGWDRTDCSPADPCECDLNTDGSCDGKDWNQFIPGWGRMDCPILAE